MNLEAFTSNYIANQSSQSQRLINPDGIITIPVVVHVLHRGESIGTGRNISLAQIQSQIDVLNEDFRRLNADRTNTPAAFAGVASDYGFEFRLACQDPNGNSTNGVLRRQTNKNTFQFIENPNHTPNETAMGIKMTSIFGEDPWPTDKYLNIWVADFDDGTLGYSTFPADFATSPNVDGVVIETTSMGRTGNVTAPFDRGRTATHEIGHWLNLRHIWGDAVCGDDFVGDTPPQHNQNYHCPGFPHTSACAGNGVNGDMFMNYMDYTDDACMNIYTNGQRLRGRAIFSTGGPRAAFTENYFQIQPSNNLIYCSARVNLFNPNCLPATWFLVSGSATLSNLANDHVIIESTTSGPVTVRATAGNYQSEATFTIDASNQITGEFTLSGQRFDYGTTGPGVSFSVCPNENLKFKPTYSNGMASADLGITEHEWAIAGNYSSHGPLSQESLKVKSASNHPNSFQISYRYKNGCGWSAFYYGQAGTINCDGGEEPFRIEDNDFEFVVSPNPAKDKVQVMITKIIGPFDIRVFDLITSKQHKYLHFEKPQNQIQLDLAGLSAGTYVVQITSNGKSRTKQVYLIK